MKVHNSLSCECQIGRPVNTVDWLSPKVTDAGKEALKARGHTARGAHAPDAGGLTDIPCLQCAGGQRCRGLGCEPSGQWLSSRRLSFATRPPCSFTLKGGSTQGIDHHAALSS
ncbi:hypothetical protein MTO96_011087 [Rhipicephalus appendiculatus]